MSPQAVEQEQQQPQTDIGVQEQIRLAEIERDNLDIVKKNRADPAIVEYEAYSHSSASEKKHSLTVSVSTVGLGVVEKGMLLIQTYTELTSVLHLGKNICGHDGIIHGGLAATILDEGLACVAIPALPNMFGFTANLNINYRKPIMSNQWVVMKAKLDKSEDRKAYVSAWIESLDGQTVFTEATSLYVSPKVPAKKPE
ncbi:thioesterase family protein [Mucor ambiguus]|uniref:Thioesterase family protein n=1 Tax=Mucor ambiguus TaxID=91626 RepID=A0A0C9M6Q7_9FUNG|nr:thioesterase family protein [Mucor ambiguus]